MITRSGHQASGLTNIYRPSLCCEAEAQYAQEMNEVLMAWSITDFPVTAPDLDCLDAIERPHSAFDVLEHSLCVSPGSLREFPDGLVET